MAHKLSHTKKWIITKTRLFKYIENFLPLRTENFQIKNAGWMADSVDPEQTQHSGSTLFSQACLSEYVE